MPSRHELPLDFLDEVPNPALNSMRTPYFFQSETLTSLGTIDNEQEYAATLFIGASENPAVIAGEQDFEEAQDFYTLEHSRRITVLASRIGIRLGLHEDDLTILALGTRLHDIGKLDPNIQELLYTPGVLKRTDLEVLAQHPTLGWGYEAVAGLPPTVLGIIGYHHIYKKEAPYPSGEALNAIAFAQRNMLLEQIVAVCDVYDAVRSERPYRTGMCPIYKAFEKIKDELSVDSSITDCLRELVTAFPVRIA